MPYLQMVLRELQLNFKNMQEKWIIGNFHTYDGETVAKFYESCNCDVDVASPKRYNFTNNPEHAYLFDSECHASDFMHNRGITGFIQKVNVKVDVSKIELPKILKEGAVISHKGVNYKIDKINRKNIELIKYE